MRSVRDGTREHQSELVRMHAETLEKISGQIRELGSDDERRHESARASLERVGSELREASAKSLSELRGNLAAHLKEVGGIVEGIDQRIGEQGVLLGGMDEGIKTALRDNERRHEIHNGAAETQLLALREDTARQFATMLAADGMNERTWHGLKEDFDALTGSLAQVARAIETIRDQLTVPLHDPVRPVDLSALLARILQPDEFERDVEIEPGTQRRVAYAVKLSHNPLTQVWLPIAVMSSSDGYHDLLAAGVYRDVERMNGSQRAFERSVLAAAQDLNARFIAPPQTMNLAVLFAPTDDLFGEIARRDTLVEELRRDFHVIIAGPGTLPTLLAGLREAFRGTAPAARRVTNGNADRNFIGQVRE